MATTHASLAADALDALDRAGVSFAFLHKEREVAAGQVGSDVDLVVDRPAAEVVRTVEWGNLHPFMVWPYDDGSASVFLFTEDARGGVQLDLTFGRGGKYDLDPAALLARAEQGERWPRLSLDDEAAYRETKRRVKAGGRTLPSVSRVVSRVRHPIGAWVNSDRVGFDLVPAGKRFAAVLPRVEVGPVSGSVRALAVVLRRLPGLLLTNGWPGAGLAADITVDDRDTDEFCRTVVLNRARQFQTPENACFQA